MKRFPSISKFLGSFNAAIAFSGALVLSSTSLTVAEPIFQQSKAADSTNLASLADGTYLYGDVAEANQVGQGYVVFKKQGQSVTGAFYYPQSEFSCFTGTVHNQRLEVLSLGLPHENAIDVEVPLTQMHRIEAVSSSEQDSLHNCQQAVAAYQQQQKIAAPVTHWIAP
ncbi:hypothetical protein [Acaryochloris sp. IP29b_bin.148]|uniref:hypothetical protein n=1 Tax=Acaryochloris sp. IP29b_bin.148 TaxID=2969218 RepID=UPI002611258A|nr:hypothetical protein [Acaryochloris sp. IP29b_bin.148]